MNNVRKLWSLLLYAKDRKESNLLTLIVEEASLNSEYGPGGSVCLTSSRLLQHSRLMTYISLTDDLAVMV